MRKRFYLFPLAALLFLAQSAQAARFTCNSSAKLPNNVPLVGYNFGIQVPVSAGGGSGVGKVTSTLSLQFPLDTTYSQLAQLVASGRHSSSCVLTDTPTSTIRVEIDFTDVIFTNLQLINGLPYGNSRSTSVVQLNASYVSYTVVPH